MSESAAFAPSPSHVAMPISAKSQNPPSANGGTTKGTFSAPLWRLLCRKKSGKSHSQAQLGIFTGCGCCQDGVLHQDGASIYTVLRYFIMVFLVAVYNFNQGQLSLKRVSVIDGAQPCHRDHLAGMARKPYP